MLLSKQNTYSFTIKSYQTDLEANLGMSHLFLMMQECAWANAQENNFGYEFVQSNNALWVLNRVLVKIKRFPKWEERIQIKTWPSGHESFYAYRDFEILKDDEVIGQVVSSWLVIDKNTRRPRKLSEIGFSYNDYIEERAISRNPDKILFPAVAEPIISRRVHYSDLDVNGHVNNASYIRWAMDAVYQKYNKVANELEINYIRELYLGDLFSISILCEQSNIFIHIENEKNKSIAIIRIPDFT